MPEIKNSFLQGKLNKDLDVRIVPNGQYTDALNVQISKADGDNIGVIHNIKGNKIVADLSLDSSYEIIGSIFDDKNNRIFWFITNGSGENHIYVWSPDTTSSLNTPMSIVSGSFLNFSKSNIIIGVNIIEDFLFWTDNLNPPRRINIKRAIENNGSYYNSEIKISVAKYAPYQAPVIVSAENDPTIKSKRIEEEFVRFAYRYKFKDNEYSILSPFTSIVFQMDDEGETIPHINENVDYVGDYGLKGLGASTMMPLMVNHINKITMQIPMPPNHYSDYEIKEVEILYKESDSIAIRVMEKIDVSSLTTVQYVYKSSNFKSTLPENQLTRVFDAVPNRALAQEVAGNRLIYGNITSKMSLPTIKFRVFSSEKGQDSIDDPAVKHQSIKQRRTYDVGIVLSDIFGRTSPVITSENSSVYVGAKNKSFDNASFIGDSLKMLFTEFTDNGTVYDAVSNPFGWYSYKVVVKQADQEYYNAYIPGIINYGTDAAYFVIHGDNVNKIPRTSEGVDFQDAFSYSKTKIYPKVVNYTLNGETSYRNSSYQLLDITEIGKLSQHKLGLTSNFFEPNKDHLIAKIPVRSGQLHEYSPLGGNFSVYETEPFHSSLDIYYETPTSGLLSDIDISPLTLGSISLSTPNPSVSEAGYAGDNICYVYAFDDVGNRIPGSLLTMSSSVADALIGFRFSDSEGEWEIYLRKTFAYDSQQTSKQISVSAQLLDYPSETISNQVFSISLTDEDPSMRLTSKEFYYFIDKEILTTGDDGVARVSGYETKAVGVGENPTLSSALFKVFSSNGSSDSMDSKTGMNYSISVKVYQPESDSFYATNPSWVSNTFGIRSNADMTSEGLFVDNASGTSVVFYQREIDFSNTLNSDGYIDYTDGGGHMQAGTDYFNSASGVLGFYHIRKDDGSASGLYVADVQLTVTVTDSQGGQSISDTVEMSLMKISSVIKPAPIDLCEDYQNPGVTIPRYTDIYIKDGVPNPQCVDNRCTDAQGQVLWKYTATGDLNLECEPNSDICPDINGQMIPAFVYNSTNNVWDPNPSCVYAEEELLCPDIDPANTEAKPCCTDADRNPASPTYGELIIVECPNPDLPPCPQRPCDPADQGEGKSFSDYFGDVLWYAPYYQPNGSLTFGPESATGNNGGAWSACNIYPPTFGVGKWTRATVYFEGNVNYDPFVPTTVGGQHPWPMWADSGLSTPAPAGWYKRQDTGVIGRYSWQSNAPSDEAQNWGWFWGPEYCASVQNNGAGLNTYTPESSDTTTGTGSTGTSGTGWVNPYDTVGTRDSQKNIP